MLPANLAPKLEPLIRRLATNHDGEHLATVAALERVLAINGASFNDLAEHVIEAKPRVIVVYRSPRPSPGRATFGDLLAMANEINGHPDLSPWEANFVAGVLQTLRRGFPLSPNSAAPWSEFDGALATRLRRERRRRPPADARPRRPLASPIRHRPVPGAP